MAILMPEGKQSFTNSTGDPLVGGKVYTYDAGTNNPRQTFSDAAGLVPNTNPVILDARGEATIFWNGTYKVVLKDALDNTIWTVDNIAANDVTAAVAALQADLLSTASAAKGAGMIGFLYSLGYVAGTVGRWLQDLALAAGSTFIGWISAGAGAVLRTVRDKLRDQNCVFDFMTTAQIADVQAGTLALDVTAAVQAAIDASYGKKLFFPKGAYKITSELKVLVYANAGVNNLGVHLFGEAMGPISGVLSGTRLQIVGNINGINVQNTTSNNGDARIIIEDMLLYGDGTNAAGGSGIIANLANNMILRNLFIQDFRNHGIFLSQCYGSSVDDCTILRCRVWGFWADQAFNLGSLRRLKIYGCGRSYSNGVQGSLFLSGTGNENLGVFIDDVDVSYAGFNAFQLFQRTNASLTNITVAAGVATVTTLAAHGLSTGNLIAVVGATVDPNLNTIYPPSITVTGANTFTFATNAANGVYNEATLVIGPASYGFLINSTRGLVLHGYSEDTIGPAVYFGAGTTSFEVEGGYWQGGIGSAVMIFDSVQRGRIAGMYLNGINARLFVNGAAGPNDVNVCSNNTYASGASVVFGSTHWMKDGQYYSAAIPTTGTWVAGARVVRSPPAVGQPKAWSCTVGGTPGTWVSEGNL